MKEVINFAGPTATIAESPIPEPNANQVLIKVVVSGSNPKDWKVPDLAASGSTNFRFLVEAKKGLNQGDDIAGVVEKVGSNVVEFKPGDRVAAFHEMCTPGGSYAEYAIAWSHTTFHLPNHTSFEEAATIPLAALTAAVSLYGHLRFPPPWAPAVKPIPFIVYGASTAVGSYAIKMASNSNIHPIIAIAGRGSQYVESLLDKSKGDTVVDYRKGVESTVKGIRSSLERAGHSVVHHAIDAVIISESAEVLQQSVTPGGQIDFILPNDLDVSPAIKSITSVGSVHNQPEFENNEELGFIFSRYFTRALQDGSFSGHPFEVRAGGLEGVEEALKDLKAGKASAVKYIFRIADTPGIV
ncbi:zinc-binding alcohol dehydrogenase family protein [Aspergillus novofumigatus IBT 16806]|uniref:GroES-like protein n=1 Tax=Aspergillus novofumigatus (strain IBT 16806) TaxID=1392255 RepID=A0A2I1BTC1_ASPN1|nr:GroES-like protein [Aspergillus novofumigatus IBT 16806]PKX88648.1 GroES-like protein [Aspergillus novofumigatus IBT 16806]